LVIPTIKVIVEGKEDEMRVEYRTGLGTILAALWMTQISDMGIPLTLFSGAILIIGYILLVWSWPE